MVKKYSNFHLDPSLCLERWRNGLLFLQLWWVEDTGCEYSGMKSDKEDPETSRPAIVGHRNTKHSTQ